MQVKETNTLKVITFHSIQEMLSYANNNPLNTCFTTHSHDISLRMSDFTQTDSFAQAEDLLLHGWEYMAEQLKGHIGANTGLVGAKKKSVYSVAGYQACVPRYLQGLPDSMITSKVVKTKQKVATINKSVAYHCKISTEQIIEQSVKLLKAVQELEQNNTRVQLYVCLPVKGGDKTYIMRVKVKASGQRMNLKQLAFPLVHPSMLRRVLLYLMEHEPFCDTKDFSVGYGMPIEAQDYLPKGEYYIPAFVEETEIKDFSKYLIR